MLEAINLNTYLSHLRNAVVLARPDGSILYANASFYGLFGHHAGLDGANLSNLLRENPVILESIHHVAEIRGIYYLREISVKRFDQSERIMDVEAFPIIGESGEMLAVSVLFYDRAVRAQLREHEKRTERIHYFGMIASGLAHEIKNPLSGIKGASQLLAEELGNKKRLKEYAEIILNEVVRVDRLLKDLLNFTKPRKLHKKKVNINQVLHDQVLLQKTVDQGGIEIIAEFDPSLPKIMADPGALTQVFLNLIKNGRQSIKEKGRVTVRSRVVTDFGLRKKDKKRQVIAVDVEDTGEGIDEKVLLNIFAPFFTTKPKGTGLGLALCHRIVEEHEGDIEVKSEKGKGTVFSVYLPV